MRIFNYYLGFQKNEPKGTEIVIPSESNWCLECKKVLSVLHAEFPFIAWRMKVSKSLGIIFLEYLDAILTLNELFLYFLLQNFL